MCPEAGAFIPSEVAPTIDFYDCKYSINIILTIGALGSGVVNKAPTSI